jgi:hypothetical protein
VSPVQPSSCFEHIYGHFQWFAAFWRTVFFKAQVSLLIPFQSGLEDVFVSGRDVDPEPQLSVSDPESMNSDPKLGHPLVLPSSGANEKQDPDPH